MATGKQWTFAEAAHRDLTDEDRAAQQDTREADSYRTGRGTAAPALAPAQGYTVAPVLQQCWGRPWDAMALNWVESLRPTGIRVARHNEPITLDACPWRVTIHLEPDDRTVWRIVQEVKVGLRGCRYGADVR